MRLTVHLNTLASMRRLSPDGTPDLLNGALAADLAGVDGLACRLDDSPGSINVKELGLLREAVRNFLAVDVEPTEALLRSVMELKPDLVTLVPAKTNNQDEGLDLAALETQLRETIRSLHAAGIDVSLLITPDIMQVKEARRLDVDYVTLNVAPFTYANSAQEALVHLEEIETTALGASKLGLHVIAARGIDHRTIPALTALGTIEEAVLDHRLYARALYIGLDRAIAEVRDAMRWQTVKG